MSKIGKKPISIPEGVTITMDSQTLVAKGPKGELKREIPIGISVHPEDKMLYVNVQDAADRHVRANWGLYRALIRNMIIGVSSGFEENLEFQGVGYKAIPSGSKLELSLGFSHTISYTAPEGITFKVEKNAIKITGIDKETVGHVAADIRAYKPPEPYKGSGVRYADEIIKKKAGKKAVAASG